MILHIWKPKARITAKLPGVPGSSLRCNFFFRRRVGAINLNRPQGVRVNRSYLPIGGIGGGLGGSGSGGGPGLGGVGLGGDGLSGIGAPLLNRFYCSHLP
jgi:hypothetical protein